jgi:WS/DGAT/MGAT family acyltransferase
MDEPGNLMVINAVMMLDEPVPFDRYRDLVASRLLTLPRMRQRIVRPALPFMLPSWESDPQFDIRYHVRLTPLQRNDQASLQELVSILMTQPLDPQRPLWQFHFVPNYENGCAVVCRFHHCIGDGLAMLYVLLTMTDTPPSAPERERDNVEEAGSDRPVLDFVTRSLSPVVSYTRNVEESVVREVRELAARPARAIDMTRDLSVGAGALGKLLLMGSDPRTVFKGPLSSAKRAVWSEPIPMQSIKDIARVSGAKINDVILAAVAGAMRRYLVSRDCRVENLDLRAVVPVNLRPIEEASELGNRFGLVFVPLPIGIEDPLDRIFAVRSRTEGIKRSPEALLTFQILRMLGVTPSPAFEAVVTLFGKRSTAVMTNVIGPREPLKIAGTTLKQVMFWVPCSGRLGMGVSIFSYAGNLSVGIATDARLVPDPERVIEGFHAEIAQLLQLVAQVRPEQPKADAPPPAREPVGAAPIEPPQPAATRTDGATPAGTVPPDRTPTGVS